jgi:glyoxalase superfamily protein
VSVRWYTLAVDCRDAPALARWWAGVLDWEVTSEDDDEVVIGPRPAAGGRAADIPVEQRVPALAFGPVPEGKQVKNRLHLELAPRAGDDHGAEVSRLLRLGATRADVGQRGDESWVVLADPEGNEFCLLSPRDD